MTEGSGYFRIKMGGVLNRIYFRPYTSDTPLIHSIFLWEKEYDVDVDADRFDAVLDLGANIGLFCILFANRFPGKKILAVEPESDNYKLLKKNTQKDTNIVTEKCGIWWRRSNLKLFDHGSNYGFTVAEAKSDDERDLIGVDIDNLCRKFDISGNLLVKMDIEGTEKNLFEHIGDAQWINRTSYLIVEIHDKEESDLYKNICNEMNKRGYTKTVKGENVVFSKI